jgi:hypothetical protein
MQKIKIYFNILHYKNSIKFIKKQDEENRITGKITGFFFRTVGNIMINFMIKYCFISEYLPNICSVLSNIKQNGNFYDTGETYFIKI